MTQPRRADVVQSYTRSANDYAELEGARLTALYKMQAAVNAARQIMQKVGIANVSIMLPETGVPLSATALKGLSPETRLMAVASSYKIAFPQANQTKVGTVRIEDIVPVRLTKAGLLLGRPAVRPRQNTRPQGITRVIPADFNTNEVSPEDNHPLATVHHQAPYNTPGAVCDMTDIVSQLADSDSIGLQFVSYEAAQQPIGIVDLPHLQRYVVPREA